MKRSRPLSFCGQGTEGKIVEIDSERRRIVGKLMSLGILPGISFRVLRCRPGFLLQCGYTIMALDSELAGYIYIETEN